jgi:hypothetical protein
VTSISLEKQSCEAAKTGGYAVWYNIKRRQRRNENENEEISAKENLKTN